nr:hypothetical protein [uncultured Oscillibacter sp.]
MSNDFGLFFTRDSTVIRLPQNPEKLPVARPSGNTDYNVLGLGQIMIPRTPNLKEVTISSYFPGRPFSGVLTSNGFEPPEFYINFFQSALDDLAPILYTPVRYYENGEPFMTGETGLMVLVSQFDTEERGGETGDFYYDLTLTEYRDYTPGTVQVTKTAQRGGLTASQEPSRALPRDQIAVGSLCQMNGPYFASSYGDGPSGNSSGRRVQVTRIVDLARPYPVHVAAEDGGTLGWTRKESLQVAAQ